MLLHPARSSCLTTGIGSGPGLCLARADSCRSSQPAASGPSPPAAGAPTHPDHHHHSQPQPQQHLPCHDDRARMLRKAAAAIAAAASLGLPPPDLVALGLMPPGCCYDASGRVVATASYPPDCHSPCRPIRCSTSPRQHPQLVTRPRAAVCLFPSHSAPAPEPDAAPPCRGSDSQLLAPEAPHVSPATAEADLGSQGSYCPGDPCQDCRSDEPWASDDADFELGLDLDFDAEVESIVAAAAAVPVATSSDGCAGGGAGALSAHYQGSTAGAGAGTGASGGDEDDDGAAEYEQWLMRRLLSDGGAADAACAAAQCPMPVESGSGTTLPTATTPNTTRPPPSAPLDPPGCNPCSQSAAVGQQLALHGSAPILSSAVSVPMLPVSHYPSAFSPGRRPPSRLSGTKHARSSSMPPPADRSCSNALSPTRHWKHPAGSSAPACWSGDSGCGPTGAAPCLPELAAASSITGALHPCAPASATAAGPTHLGHSSGSSELEPCPVPSDPSLQAAKRLHSRPHAALSVPYTSYGIPSIHCHPASSSTYPPQPSWTVVGSCSAAAPCVPYPPSYPSRCPCPGCRLAVPPYPSPPLPGSYYSLSAYPYYPPHMTAVPAFHPGTCSAAPWPAAPGHTRHPVRQARPWLTAPPPHAYSGRLSLPRAGSAPPMPSHTQPGAPAPGPCRSAAGLAATAIILLPTVTPAGA